jgi:hypothetical protein
MIERRLAWRRLAILDVDRPPGVADGRSPG